MRLMKSLSFVTYMFAWSVGACEHAELESTLQYFSEPGNPGLVALIAQDGKVLCQGAQGSANLELSVPMQAHHIFEIGSLTKQFTAAAILLLEQDGQLSRSDPITKYIAGINTTKGQVTVEHLLSHTSGLVDPINEPDFLRTRVQELIAFADLVALFKNDHWQHPPGERIVYSNAGYSLLSSIIEKVSGMSYATFLEHRIFAPLSMSGSFQASMAITPDKATGYTFDENTPRQHDLLNLGWAYGAADLLSNVQDLSAFSHALMQGKLLNEQQLNALFRPIVLNDSTQLEGAYTASLQNIFGFSTIRMSGSTLGYSSHSFYLPKQRIYIVVLKNSDGVNGGAWIPPATVAGKLLANTLSLPVPDYQRVDLTDKQALLLTGKYLLDEDTTRTITFRDGTLYYQRNQGPIFEVVPMSNHRLFFKDTLDYMQFSDVGTNNQSMAFYAFLSDTPEVAIRTQ